MKEDKSGKKPASKKVKGKVKGELKKSRKRPNTQPESNTMKPVVIELPAGATAKQKKLHKELLKLQAEYHKELGKAASSLNVTQIEVNNTPEVDIYARSEHEGAGKGEEYEQLAMELDTETPQTAISTPLESNNTYNHTDRNELMQDRDAKTPAGSKNIGHQVENSTLVAGREVLESVENDGERAVSGQNHNDKTSQSNIEDDTPLKTLDEAAQFKVGVFLEDHFPFKTKQTAITPSHIYNMITDYSQNTLSITDTIKKHPPLSP